MKYADAWSELRTTMELLENFYEKTQSFPQALAVVKAVQKNMDHLEEKYE